MNRLKYSLFLASLLFLSFFAGSQVNIKAQDVNTSGNISTSGGLTYYYPSNGMCPSDSVIIEVKVLNYGSAPITATVLNPIVVTAVIVGPINQTFTTNLTSGTIQPTRSTTVRINLLADFTKKGEYTFNLSASYPGDVSSGVDASEGISVEGNYLNISSLASTSNQTVCLNSNIVNITYDVSGNTTLLTTSGLPPGLISNFDYPTLTIYGAPTSNAATPYNYSVTASGACPSSEDSTLYGSISVKSLPTVSVTGATAICVGSSSNLAPNSGGTWVSSNNSIATVTSGGLVSGVAAGSVNFTFTDNVTGCSNATASSIVVTAPPTTGVLSGTQSICVGGTSTFSSTVLTGSWLSSNPSVASINANSGLISGIANGVANMTYTVLGTGGCSNVTASRSVTVTAPPNPGNLSGISSICNPGTTTLFSNISGGSWSSSNPAVATINPVSGSVNAVSAGSAIMHYTMPGIGGCSDVDSTKTIVVTAPPIPGSLSGNQSICVAGSSAFTSTVVGGNWTSLAPTTASIIGATGAITGVSPGTATMKYTVTGTGGCADVYDTRTVTVTAPPNPGVLSGNQAICNPGTTTFSSTISGGIWSTGSPTVATIDVNGNINAVSPGNSTISYTATGSGGCADVAATRILTVTAPPVAGVLSGNQTICVAGTTTFTSTSPGGSWSSANPLIASVNPSTGVVTGVGAGIINIIYTVSGTGGCSDAVASRSLTVTAPPDPGVLSGVNEICNAGTSTFISSVSGGTWNSASPLVASIDANTGDIIAVSVGSSIMSYTVLGSGGCSNVSATRLLTVSAPPTAGTLSGNQDICANGTTTFTPSVPGGIWSTSDPLKANVSGGLVSGVSAGSATISYTIVGTGGCSDAIITRKVNVTAVPNPGVISGNQEICTDGSTTFKTDGDIGGVWSSNMLGVATVNSSSGVISPLSSGTSTISYTVIGTGGCLDVSSTRDVIVTSPPNSGDLSGVQSICANGTTTFTPSVPGGIWSTSDPLKANVSGGLISGFSAGTATISYTVLGTGGCSDAVTTRTVSVTAVPNPGVLSGNQSVCVSSSSTFTSSITGGTWSSNDILIATITSNGNINTLLPGNVDMKYTVTGTGGCSDVFDTRSLTVIPSNTSSVASSSPTICINSVLTDITHTTTGATGIGSAVGLPNGVNAQWSGNTITISGTPTQSGTFDYTIPLTGGCGSVNAIGKIIVTPTNTASVASSSPTICINTVLTNITHTTTGATGIGAAVGLPNGVTAQWLGNTITISGTPTQSGTFDYSIPLTGGCGNVNAIGKIIVTPINTVSTASSSPTVCNNTAITNITHTTTGATGIGAAVGLPNGVTAQWSGNTITISGTPTQSGTFDYSIPLTGGCDNITATGKIIVTPTNTASVASSSPTICINTELTNITHTTTGATGIGAAIGLPNGVTAQWLGNTITISGTPTQSGTFDYTIPLTGGCGSVTATGKIIVTAINTVSTASSSPTVCNNTAITNITHTTTGATGIGTAVGLPNGVTAQWLGNTITISGTPTQSGTFDYTIPLTGGCGSVTATGKIIVTPTNTASVASSSPTICINTLVTNITHTTTGATGIGAANGLPNGVTAQWLGNTITISGTPTQSGTFDYTIPLTGGCGSVTATGKIIVTATNTASVASSSPTICNNTAITNITHTTTGATGIGVVVGLPTGLTAQWSGNTITISGTPTQTGTFDYSIPLTGGCGSVNAIGKIIVTPINTVSTASSSPTVCNNTAITSITHTTTGATGIGAAVGLPTGVTAQWSGNTITISGTPTQAGTFDYSIPLNGGCGNITATGKIIVTPTNTASVASSSPTICINSLLSNITHTTTGATGIGAAVGLPNGVTAQWLGNTITISGTPTQSGTFDYSIPLTGGCGSVNATGKIIVNPKPVITPIIGKTDICMGETSSLSSSTIGGSWSSVSTGIATINSSGVVTPVSAGTTIINYSLTIGGCTNSISTSVNVFALPVVSNIVGKDSLCVGDNLTLSNPTNGGVWSSGSPSVATILNGVVSGLNSGKTKISYTVTTNGCSTSKTLDVTVNAYPVVSAILGTSDVCVGSTSQLTNSTPLGVWSSLNTAVATINAFGLVTGKTAGTTAVSYKVTNANCSKTSTINITVKEALGVAAIIGTTDICIGSNSQLTNATIGGTWTSTNPSVATVNSSGLVNSVAVGSTTIRYDVVTNGVCQQFASVNFTVNEIPTVDALSDIVVCNGSTVNTINFTGTGSPIFHWTNNNTNIGLTSIGTGNISSFISSGTVIGASSEIGVINVTPIANGCSGIPKQFLITVNSKDNAGFNYQSTSFCKLDADPSPIITGLSGGLFSSSSVDLALNINTGVVDLSNSKPGYYKITYTTKGSCPNDSVIDFAISELPTLNPVSDQQVCDGSSFAPINFAGSPGTIFNWSNDNTNIGLGVNGVGNISSFVSTGTSVGGSSISSRIIVTPISGSCLGIKDTFLLTVRPKDNPTFTYPSNSFCSTLDPNPIANITGKIGGVFAMSPSGAIFNANTGAITLASSNAGTYTLTYTTNGTCSNSQSITLTIGSNPSVSAITSQTICSGSSFKAINFSGTAGTSFNWSSNNPSLLGLASSGVGNINSFIGSGATANNPIVTSTITVTPKIGSCTGASKNFNLSVSYKDEVSISYPESSFCNLNSNPSPTISGTSGGVFSSTPAGLILNTLTGTIDIAASSEGNYKVFYITSGTCGDTALANVSINNSPSVNNIPDQTVCSGINFTEIKFTGTIGTEYNWSNSNTLIGLKSSGNGNINSFIGTNSTNNTITSIITITPKSGACIGPIKTFNLSVNPTEDASFSYNVNSICQNNEDLTPTIQGTKGGVFSAGNGLVINPSTGKISVAASNPGSYNVVYKTSGSCFNIKSSPITINATPTVDDISNFEKCEGISFEPISFSGTVGASFSWSNSNNSIGLASSGIGNISSFVASGTSLGGSPTSAVITVTPSINGCFGNSKSFILTTNSMDNPGFTYTDNSYCFSETNPTPVITGRTGGKFTIFPSTGLTIDPSTGTLDLSSATAGNYQITYKTNGFCQNDSMVSISVGTAPLALPVTSQVVCQGTSFSSIDFQGAPGTVYEWTNSNTAIGLASSGIGNISSFIADGTSVGGANLISNVTVMPKIGSCIGDPITFTLTVKPLDNAQFSYTNSSYCKNQANPTPTILGLTGGTFSSTPIGLSMNSVGTINLATSTAGNYSVTYTTHGQCPNVSSLPMAIGSSPSVNSISDQFVCLGNNFSSINFSGNPGTIYNWTNNNTNIGLASSGTGDIDVFKSQGVGSSIIVVTPIIGSCAGTSKTFTLTVNSVQNSTIQYGQSSYCISDSDPTPVQTGPLNGVFSASPSGLVVNPSTGIINLALSKPGDYTINYALNSQCSTSSSTSVSIGNSPTVNAISISPICNGATFNNINFTGTPGTQFSWTNSNVNIGLPVSGKGDIASFLGVNNTNSNITSIVTVTPSVGTCIGTSKTFNLVIRPSDDPSFSFVNDNICFNDADITPKITGTSGGVFSAMPIGLNINASSGKINVANSLPGTYNVTYLTSGNCPKAKTEAIVLNPLPYVNNLSINPKCQGSVFSSMTFNGSQNTIFNWKNSNTSIGLNASGIGLVPSFTASGTTKNGPSVTGIITVTPEINGCKGSLMSFPVTVLSLDDATFKYPKSSICQTDANPLPIITGTTGGVFTSTPSGLSINPSTGRITIGTSFVGSYGVTYTTNGSCPKDTTISIQLNALPEVNIVSNQNRCFGDSFNPVTFSGTPNTIFNWVNSNANIGLPVSGNGNIAAFVAKGTVFGGSSVVGKVTVTPEINGCFGSTKTFDFTVNPIDNPAFHYSDNSFCTTQSDPSPIIDGTLGGVFSSTPVGLSLNATTGKINLVSTTPGMYQIKYTTPGNCKDDSTVTIGIGSSPSVDDVDDQSYCQGDMFDPVVFSGNAGTIFQWVNSNVNVGIPSSGIGNIQGFKASGTIDGGSDASATITVTPRIGSCIGSHVNYKYKVRANPRIIASIANTTKQDTSFCRGGIALLSASGASKNENYVWTPHTSLVGNLGIGANVTTKTDTTQQYIVRGQSQFGCYNYDTLSINVYNPIVDQKKDTIVCAGTLINSIPFISNLKGTTFEWTNSNANIGLGFNGVGDINTFSAKNITNTTKQTAVISVTPKFLIPTINKTCVGPVMKFSISVNKLDDPGFTGYLAQYCTNETSNTVPVVSGMKGGVFSALPLGLALNSNSGEIFPISSKAGSYSVKYTTNGVCPRADSIYLFINPLISASISGSDTVCVNAVSPQIKFKGFNGVAPYIFKYKVNGGSVQIASSDPGKDEVSIAVPTNKSGVFSYELVSVEESSSSQCKNDKVFGVQTVIVNELPTAQITSTSTSVCLGGVSPEIRITGINGVSPFTFTYFISKDGNPFGASQNISTVQGQYLAKIPVNTSLSGVYNYTVNIVKNGDDLSCSNNINISQTVTIKPLPTGNVTAKPSGVCMNGESSIDFTALNGTPPFTFVYTINNSGSQTIKTANSAYTVSLKANTNSAGIFNYKIISISDGDITSCQNNNVNSSVDLNVTPGTKVNKVQDINVCVNEKSDTIEFTGGVNGTNYEWYSNNITVGVTGSGSGNILPFIAKNNSGSTTNISRITVIPSVGQCKGDTMKFDIVVRPKPKAKINGPNTVCPGDSILLEGIGSELKYVWTPNVSCITCNPVIAKPLENTTYKAFVTDKYNCFDSTEFDVVVYRKPEINIDEPIVCGDPKLVMLKGKDNNTYTYSDGILDGVPFMPKFGKTSYLVTVKDILGCKNTDTVNVYVVDKPISKFNASPEYGLASDLKPLNILLNNKSSNSNEFEWYFRNGEESPLFKNTLEPVTALYKKPGIYVITLIAKNGKCIDSSSISIKVDKLDTPRVEIAPNVFTPDNDGTNDAFFITVKNAKDIHVIIFNRWGNPIYEMTETSQSWDGRINGKDADEGVYYYQYEVEGSSGEKLKGQGYVQLIRK